MITKESLKGEIDKIQDKYLEVLYRLIKSFIGPSDNGVDQPNEKTAAWHDFIEQTYGSLADDPNDLMIASIAVANSIVLVTHNTREFGRISNLEIKDWESNE